MGNDVFYGAGRNALKRWNEWIAEGYDPVCVVDKSEEKQKTGIFCGKKVLSLRDAMEQYKDFRLLLTQVYPNNLEVKEDLIKNGIAEDRIYLLENPFLAEHALKNYTKLLSKSFKNMISELIQYENYKVFKPIRFADDVFQVWQLFITNQEELEEFYQHLDKESQKTYYYLVYMWLITQLYLDNPREIHYKKEWRYYDFREMHKIVAGGWDIEGDKTDNTIEEHYMCIENIMPQGAIVIDAGAYIGDTAQIFLNHGAGKVYAFEPFKDSYEQMVEKKLPNVVCINKGLYSEDTTLKFMIHEDEPGGNSISYVEYAVNVGTIDVTTIDKYVSDNNIEKIDLIKMDIEGSELFALQGAKKSIRRFKPNMEICIYHNYGTDLIKVPLYLQQEYGDIYDFIVRHHSIGWYESVIYAVRKEMNEKC